LWNFQPSLVLNSWFRRKVLCLSVQKGTEGSDMTPVDGFLMIAGFAWGCLPMIEWLIERRSPGFKRSSQKLAPSPWI
jgi:hypothetical protein